MRDVGTAAAARGDDRVTPRPAPAVARRHGRDGGPRLGVVGPSDVAAVRQPLAAVRRSGDGRRARPGLPQRGATDRRRGMAAASPSWRRTSRASSSSTLRHDLTPLVDALATTPTSFLHGDWKMGNLGIGADGRTILLDWTYCGAGPVCHELGWYLALNRARLPESKEATIDRAARGAASATASTPRRGGTGSSRLSPARHARAVRLGEGARRPGRARLVVRPRRRRARRSCDRERSARRPPRLPALGRTGRR